MQQMLRIIISGVTDNVGTSGLLTIFLEATSVKLHDNAPSPRVFFAHLPFSLLPCDTLDKKCKLIHCLRNPKDQAVSFFHHTKGIKLYEYDGKWENYLDMSLEGTDDFGSWFDYVMEWKKATEEHSDLHIHLTYFEDIKENPVQEIKRLCQFLNLNISDELFHDIALRTDFENMAEDKKKEPRPSILNDAFNILRKGHVGDWKKLFTVAQGERFDFCFQEKMKISRR